MDFQRVSCPPLCPRKKTDSAGSSWPCRDDGPGPNCDHRTAERADHSGFPTGGGTCGPWEGNRSRYRFLGALACQGLGNGHLPGKAQGFRGQDTVERHGRFSAATVRKVLEWEQENPAAKGREMIDDFRLRGSRPCRHIHAPLKKGGWLIQAAHAFDNPNAPLSEGGALAVVVKCLRGKPDWTRVGTDCPHPLRQAWRGGAPRVPASPGAPHERGAGGESDPLFFAAGAAPGGGRWCTPKFTTSPPLWGSLSPH